MNLNSLRRIADSTDLKVMANDVYNGLKHIGGEYAKLVSSKSEILQGLKEGECYPEFRVNENSPHAEEDWDGFLEEMDLELTPKLNALEDRLKSKYPDWDISMMVDLDTISIEITNFDMRS